MSDSKGSVKRFLEGGRREAAGSAGARKVFFIDKNGDYLRVTSNRVETDIHIPFRGHLQELPRKGEKIVTKGFARIFEVIDVRHELFTNSKVEPKIYIVLEEVQESGE